MMLYNKIEVAYLAMFPLWSTIMRRLKALV